jgi:hypothetical protein
MISIMGEQASHDKLSLRTNRQREREDAVRYKASCSVNVKTEYATRQAAA